MHGLSGQISFPQEEHEALHIPQQIIIMCHDCAFRDGFNVVKEHNHEHSLIKIKDRVQDADETSEELVDSKKIDDANSLASLSSRVDNLAAMMELLDRRLGELIDLSMKSV
jgi:hypothetical protein